MYISQRSVYENSNLTSIVPLYSRGRDTKKTKPMTNIGVITAYLNS